MKQNKNNKEILKTNNGQIKETLHEDSLLSANLSSDTINDTLQEKQNNVEEEVFITALNQSVKSIQIQERLAFVWKRIGESTNHLEQKRIVKLRMFKSVAASIAILIGTAGAYFLYHKNSSTGTILLADFPALKFNDIESEGAIILFDGTNKFKVSGDTAIVDHSSSDVLFINKEPIGITHTSSEYNQLIVPYGKRSSLILADGTKIWLNSGSRVIYPTKFTGKQREIYIDGEVYADVTPNKNMPFVLKTKNLEIGVLGTELNITAYEKDSTQRVVLVEGSVKVSERGRNNKATILEPNQMFFSSLTKNYTVTVDVEQYISWRKGYYSFKDEDISSVFRRLSRYYNIDIDYQPAGRAVICSGGLDLKDSIEKILNGICKSTTLSYELKNNKYIFYNNP